MAYATQEPMLQPDCALATKQKKKEDSVESGQKRPPADLGDREWTVKSGPDRARSRSGPDNTV